MLEKTMKQILNKKINDWFNTIEDDAVLAAIKKDLIITGGCFTSLIQNEKPNDFDCYFRTKETLLLVANYYVNIWNKTHKDQENKIGSKTKVFVLDGENPSTELLDYYNIKQLSDSKSRMISNTPADRVKIIFPSDGVVGNTEDIKMPADELDSNDIINFLDDLDNISSEEKDIKKYKPVFITTNAISLSDKIQLIIRFYGDSEEIHKNFDFEHTKSYYDFGENKLVIPKSVYEYTTNKTLKYTGSLYPVCSLFRLRKFIKRGWTINAGQILKISMQISELNLLDIDVLEEQLIGVDSIYFANLIKQFNVSKSNNPDFVLNCSYVISIIDKIF